jgi:isoprenylcysteine carboxyl methyltransferase (ICMT) family protein YpbQ
MFSKDHMTLISRDIEKNMHCNQLDITLIHIPYWWDLRIQSLAATIKKAFHSLSSLLIFLFRTVLGWKLLGIFDLAWRMKYLAIPRAREGSKIIKSS